MKLGSCLRLVYPLWVFFPSMKIRLFNYPLGCRKQLNYCRKGFKSGY